jgi:hypothetical protein
MEAFPALVIVSNSFLHKRKKPPENGRLLVGSNCVGLDKQKSPRGVPAGSPRSESFDHIHW